MRQQGFTLVELAIVMTIIGLLIGGVIKGQELVRNARVNKTVEMIHAVEAATLTFRDVYANLPGDHPYATSRIQGCTAANFCQSGDGNNRVITGNTDPTWTSAITDPEPTQFWKHLALANFMKGIVPSADPSAKLFGRTHPTLPIGGGIEYYYDRVMVTGGAGGGRTSSHLMRLTNGPPGTPSNPVASTLEAFSLDEKIDDGMPNTGVLVADYGVTGSNQCKLNTSGVVTYKTASSTGRCVLFYKVP